MSLDVYFEAPIEPKGAKRPRFTKAGGGRVYTPKVTHQWQSALALAAAPAMPAERIDYPVRVDVVALLPRPKRLMRKKDEPGLVWAPVTPDVDNIAKNVLDALKTFWTDDRLACGGEVSKCYHAQAGRPLVAVRIRALSESTAALHARRLLVSDGPHLPAWLCDDEWGAES